MHSCFLIALYIFNKHFIHVINDPPKVVLPNISNYVLFIEILRLLPGGVDRPAGGQQLSPDLQATHHTQSSIQVSYININVVCHILPLNR